QMPPSAQPGKCGRGNESEWRQGLFRRRPAINPAESSSDQKNKRRRAEKRVQHCSMETQKSSRPGEIAEVIQIRGHSRNDQNGGAKSRQPLSRGARQRQ